MMIVRAAVAAALTLSLLAAPLVVEAQQAGKIPRVGVMAIGSGTPPSPTYEAFRQGLRDLGWIEGQNIIVDVRWTPTVDRLPEMAAEFVRMRVDVIFAASSTQVEPARQATKTIPIVFATHADPIGVGHVASLARPGGNITGLAQLLTELSAKELELLREALPQVTRIGVLWNPTTPSHPPALRAVDGAAETLGVQVQRVPAQSADEFDTALSTMTQARAGAFLVLPSPLTYVQRARLAEVALKRRLPGMFGFRENAEAGGLMSYGPDLKDLFRRAAIYVDKILKGAKPADLPVEQAQKFELVINLQTAKALGLTIPQSLLLRADEIIQ
jgi:putative ABC transport system substrate-binding protein